VLQQLLPTSTALETDAAPFFAAVKAGDTAAVQRHLDAGLNVHAKDPDPAHDGWEAIHVAAQLGNADIVQLLLDRGARPDEKTKAGETPLELALRAKHPEVAALLIASGADLGGGQAEMALQLSAQNGYASLMQTLLSRQTRIDAKGDEGRTALHWAVSNGSMDVVRLLLFRGADPNARDDSGATPLHLAVASARRDLVELLVDRGSDVNATDAGGQTPLHLALNSSEKAIAQFLLDMGGRVDAAAAAPLKTPIR
jgi:cytohesin